jgi:mevalonate kinase
VDNSVSVYGGALAYTRAGFVRKPGMESIQGFKSLRFLLTNSNVAGRDGKKMIANVGQLKIDVRS